jgi:Phytochelatin synthase
MSRFVGSHGLVSGKVPRFIAVMQIGGSMKTRFRIVALLALAFVVVLVAAAALWMLAAMRGDPAYAHVASIERTTTFRNATLIAQAERLPVAASYLSHSYEYQHNGSVCGPTSAADLLHSIGRRESQEEVMAGGGVHTIFGLLIPGLTLDQEAALLRRVTGDPVTLLRNLDLQSFRSYLEGANDTARRFIVNFHRGPMFGRGSGHFSPILAYLPDRDLVLVGDVNHDYGTYLVSSARLFAAMNTIDSITGMKRGLLMVALRAPSGR